MSKTPKKTLGERIADADERANRWLADGNDALERGNKDKANECFEKCQYWKDRYTLLKNQAERAGPSQ